MHTSHSPPDRAPSKRESYFPVSSIPTSSRQRTAQACDKCRERKTKCSGEKPVCQRCSNRGLICEYSCREPRMRGLSKTRLMSTSTPPITAGVEKQRVPLLPSLTRGNFSRSYSAIIPAEYTVSSYVPSFAASKHSSSSSPYLGNEARTYSVMPHTPWADVRLCPSALPSNYDGSQLRMTAPRGTIKLEYDPYRPSKYLPKRHNGVLNSTSSFVFEAQENPRYNNSDHSSLYNYPTGHLAESSLSGSSGSSSPGYHSNSALSSSTPPFYSQESLKDAAPPEAFGGLVMSEYNHDTTGKRVYQNNDLVSVKLPYSSKDAEIQEGWSMSDNSITDRIDQQASTLCPEFMWTVGVDLNVCRLGVEKGVQ